MLLSLLLACSTPGADDAADSDVPVDPIAFWDARGPWGVGYRVSAMTWDDPISGAPRTLRLALWYPTDSAGEDPIRYRGLTAAEGVLDDPEPADGPFPLAVFSHGHQGFAENLGHVLSNLASHGWVAVAPDHTNNTTFDGPDRDTAIYLQRPLDISAVLDHMLAGAEPDMPALDGRVLGLGHSFGGYTMLALAGARYDTANLCLVDDGDGLCTDWTPQISDRLGRGFLEPRLSGVVAFAPGDYRRFGDAGIAEMSLPMLLGSGSLDGDDPDAIWAALPAGTPNWRIHVTGAGHQAWTDFAAFPGIDADGAMSRDQSLRITRIYTGAFASQQTLEEGGSSVLDGTLAVDDTVALSSKAP